MKWVSLITVLCLSPAGAWAQVTVNPAALAQLAGIFSPPPIAGPPARPLFHRVSHRDVSHRVVHRAVVIVKPPPPAVPPVQPLALPPVQQAVAKPAPPPLASKPAPVLPAVARPVAPPAPKHAMPLPTVLDFSPGSAALPSAAAAALQPFCAAHGATLIIDAYAPPDPADPSAAMRLSLSRAFALRDALTACGVPGTQIIPRADGATGANPEIARIFVSGAAP